MPRASNGVHNNSLDVVSLEPPSFVKICERSEIKAKAESKPKTVTMTNTALNSMVAIIAPKAAARPAAKPIAVLSILQENASHPGVIWRVKIAYQLGTTNAMTKPG